MEGMELAPKVKNTYRAVIELMIEGADLNSLTVAEITARAGIGKGTAYEYFSNKEEMIAGALFYEVECSCRDLCGRIEKQKNLYEKMNLILMDMEKHIVKTNCFLRAVQILMDNSAISSKLHEMIRSKRANEILIMDMIGMIIEEEISDSQSMTAENRTYLTMMILSKIVCFAMYLFSVKNEIRSDSSIMRELICKNTCQEIENFKKLE